MERERTRTGDAKTRDRKAAPLHLPTYGVFDLWLQARKYLPWLRCCGSGVSP
jgi:hypothetical protein